VSSALNPPVPGKNKYVVFDSVQDRFVEFPIRLDEVQVGNFLEISVLPPIRREGFLSYKKQTYKVTLHDLLRNHVNVNTPYSRPITTNSSRSTSDVGTQPTNVANKLRPKESPGDELDKESSLYWEEQISTLLNSED